MTRYRSARVRTRALRHVLLARSSLLVGLTVLTLACASDDNTGQTGPGATPYEAGVAPVVAIMDSSAPVITTTPDAGTTPPAAKDSGTVVVTTTDSAVTPIDSGSVVSSDGGSTNSGDAASADASTAGGGGNSLTGTYGSLGAVKPIVSAYWISTGLETIVYLSSAPLTCAQVMTEGGRWLLMLPSGAQVLELVVRGAAKVGTVKISPAEANYAEGGKSSSTETTASSGSLTFTKAEAKGVIEGMVMASYSSLFGGSGDVMGTFHAEYCDAGQEW
jgi:hypothetical protein